MVLELWVLLVIYAFDLLSQNSHEDRLILRFKLQKVALILVL